MNSVKKKYQIKNKFRFTIFITLLLLFSSVTFGTAFGLNTSESLTKPAYYEIQIEAGDTLWDLAKIYGSKDQDIRRSINTICKVNNISPEDIYPGQYILIPRAI